MIKVDAENYVINQSWDVNGNYKNVADEIGIMVYNEPPFNWANSYTQGADKAAGKKNCLYYCMTAKCSLSWCRLAHNYQSTLECHSWRCLRHCPSCRHPSCCINRSEWWLQRIDGLVRFFLSFLIP